MVGRNAATVWRVLSDDLSVIDGVKTIGRAVHVTRPSIKRPTLLLYFLQANPSAPLAKPSAGPTWLAVAAAAQLRARCRR